MPKKNLLTRYTPEAQGHPYVVDLRVAIGVFTASIIGALVTGAAGAFYVLNTDHFTLATLATRVTEIEAFRGELIPRFLVLEEQNKQQQEDIKEIKTDVKELLKRTR